MEVIDLSDSSSSCKDVPAAPMLVHEGTAGGLIQQDYLLICGGYTGGGQCHTYEGRSWQATAVSKQAKYYSSFSPSPFLPTPHSILVVGGRSGDSDLSELEQTSTSDYWDQSLPKLPVTQAYGCMVNINSTTVMVIGGYQNKARSDKTFYISKDKRVWSEGPKLLIPRSCFGCARIRSNESNIKFSVIIAAGWDGGKRLSTTEILDLGTGLWRPGPELPFGIGCAPLVEDADGGVILVGGEANDGSHKLNKLFRLPHAGDGSRWTELPQKLKTGRSRHVSFMVPDHLTNCN